ncbi:MAG: hypothetical protein HC836_34705 [Richelia sp. RM2_1_2]|nr:hypothetical protein [Richelia sp. RM2_1_2]
MKLSNELILKLKSFGFKKKILYYSSLKFEMVKQIKVFGRNGYVVVNSDSIVVDISGDEIFSIKSTSKNLDKTLDYLRQLPIGWGGIN